MDNYPGDRENPCGGMMEPEGVEFQKGIYHIRHVCQKCGVHARCKSLAEDNVEALSALSESLAKRLLENGMPQPIINSLREGVKTI